MREQPPQLRPRLEQLRFASAGGDAQRLGDLLVRVSFHVVQQEYRSRARRELLGGVVDRRCQQRPICLVLD